MIYGFDDTKVKIPVVPCGHIVERTGEPESGSGVYSIDGEDYIRYAAEKDGLFFCVLDTATDGAVVRSTGSAGAAVTVTINDFTIGTFYVGPNERSYLYTPAFPVKEDDVILLSNRYSDTKVYAAIRFYSFEEI